MKQAILFFLFGLFIIFNSFGQDRFGYYYRDSLVAQVHLFQKKNKELDSLEKSFTKELIKIATQYSEFIRQNHHELDQMQALKKDQLWLDSIKIYQKNCLHILDSLKSRNQFYIDNKIYMVKSLYKKENGFREINSKSVVIYCPSCSDLTSKLISKFNESQEYTILTTH